MGQFVGWHAILALNRPQQPCANQPIQHWREGRRGCVERQCQFSGATHGLSALRCHQFGQQCPRQCSVVAAQTDQLIVEILLQNAACPADLRITSQCDRPLTDWQAAIECATDQLQLWWHDLRIRTASQVVEQLLDQRWLVAHTQLFNRGGDRLASLDARERQDTHPVAEHLGNAPLQFVD